ncbi:internalin C2, partial [Listeria monocytogenes FSL F2-208]
DPTPNTPTGNGDGTSSPSNSGGNTTLPAAGDENIMLPIFVGAVLIGMGLVLFRKKRQTK